MGSQYRWYNNPRALSHRWLHSSNLRENQFFRFQTTLRSYDTFNLSSTDFLSPISWTTTGRKAEPPVSSSQRFLRLASTINDVQTHIRSPKYVCEVDLGVRNELCNTTTTRSSIVKQLCFFVIEICWIAWLKKIVDTLLDHQDSFGRCRVEWPIRDTNTWQIIQGNSESEQIPQFAKTVVDGELAKCDTSTGFVSDTQVFDQVYARRPKLPQLIAQPLLESSAAVGYMTGFQTACEGAYINPVCLHLSVSFDQHSTSDTIVDLLRCISFESMIIFHCRVLDGTKTSSGRSLFSSTYLYEQFG